ncbi:MAG: hypothetical protein ACREBG_06655 [Pyrinomonadaceae bacterium]
MSETQPLYWERARLARNERAARTGFWRRVSGSRLAALAAGETPAVPVFAFECTLTERKYSEIPWFSRKTGLP